MTVKFDDYYSCVENCLPFNAIVTALAMFSVSKEKGYCAKQSGLEAVRGEH